MYARAEAGRVGWIAALVVVVALAVGAYVVLSPSNPLSKLDPRPEPPSASGPGDVPPDGSPTSAEPAQPGIVLPEVPDPTSVLPAALASPVSARALRSAVGAELRSPRLGSYLGFAVAQLGSDELLMSTGTRQTVTPASTTKLLTAMTALHLLGPEHRFVTKVVEGRDARHLVLVGGGDPLLTDRRLTAENRAATYPPIATLQRLAADTADRLREAGVQRVSVGFDDSLFEGPAVNPRWEPSYIPDSVVSPISPLWVDEGRETVGLALRVSDPAQVAADRFASLLADQGVDVRTPVARVRTAESARRLAAVKSAPLRQIVQHTLEISDNEAAEVLLRHTAVAAGRRGTATAGVQVVSNTLSDLGVRMAGARLYDGSGLSRDNRLPIESLVDVLQVAADLEQPHLRAVISTLPVAGFSGSLDYRFTREPAGLGLVRAKTGTLTGVHGLAGVASTRGGHLVVFAAVADRVPVPKTYAARDQLDRIAGALSSCRC
jgi:D-alanyl-D-alanine carboxypeptidase/D-alanyl-D-alanine-endopeptidase (penicillin-binding protein 4)